jgi:hypothetical protein
MPSADGIGGHLGAELSTRTGTIALFETIRMTWLPHFLNPFYAALAAVAAVPLLLLLYFLKLRRKEMPVASTLLWRKAIQDLQVNSPFQRLRRNLLLLLQLLLLLLLCLAFSRPVTFYTPGAGRVSVLLIDRSASMNATDPAYKGRTRLDEAKRQAKDLVDSMERGATAMVIAFDDRAETVQPFTSDAVALKSAIDSIKPTDRKTRLKLAYQLAEAQMNIDPLRIQTGVVQEEPDVDVFSDGRVLDAGDLAIRGNVKYRPIGTDKATNIAIVAMSAKRNYERPTQVQVFARLADYGPDPVKADVELRVSQIDPADPHGDISHDHFQLRGAASVDLLPDRWSEADRQKAEQDQGLHERDSVEFTLDLSTAAVIRVEQKQTDGDCLAADDSAQVAVPPPKPLSVCLVTDGDYFMERMISSLNLKNAAVITPQQYEATIPSNYDVIIFDRAYTPPKLPPAGNFIYFGSIAPGLKLKPYMDNGKTVMLDSMGVLDWKRDHPILKNLALKRLRVQEAEKLDVPADAEVLVEGVKGPLVVLDREGKSTHLAIAFDLLQSDWPTQPTFPYFMYNALQYLAVGTDLGMAQSFDPGSTPRIPRANLAMAADALNVPELKSIRLNGPDGSRDVPIPPTGDFALPALNKVGVYTTDPVIPEYERLVVNLLDSNESNLLPLVDKAPGGVGSAIASAGARSRLDLWWWIVACCALPLLLIEWFVYTRRVHL